VLFDRFEDVDHVARVGNDDDGQGVGDAGVHAYRQAVGVKVGHYGDEPLVGFFSFSADVKEGSVGD